MTLLQGSSDDIMPLSTCVEPFTSTQQVDKSGLSSSLPSLPTLSIVHPHTLPCLCPLSSTPKILLCFDVPFILSPPSNTFFTSTFHHTSFSYVYFA